MRRGGGGGGVLKILYERLHPEVHTPPFYIAFLQKSYAFRISSIDKWERYLPLTGKLKERWALTKSQ